MSTKIKTTDETEIHRVIDDWVDSLRNKNADGVLSHYAPGLVHFSLAPPLLSSVSNAKGLKEWFTTWQGPIGYEVRDLSVTVGNDVAFSHSLNRMHGTKTDGTKGDLWFRHTFGFRRSMASGRSRTNTGLCPFTWMAAIKPPWTLSRR